MTQPIVVLGMQRSGTSALSGALNRLGVYFGPEEMLYQGDANNPLGYFEHRKATLLNLKILEEFQMHVTSYTSLPPTWRVFPEGEQLFGLLKNFVEEFQGYQRWAIKQPLTSLVLPIYNAVFQELGLEPHYVVCVRHPLEAMESESRLDFGDSYRVMPSLGKRAIGSWLRYTLGSICEAVPHSVTVVLYDDLMGEPRQVLEKIVGLHPEWNPTKDQWQTAVSSIRTELRHHRRPASDLNALPDLVRRALEAVSANSDVRDLYLEFQTWVRMLGGAPPPLGKVLLAWPQTGGATASFQVKPEWQNIRLSVPALPRTVVSGRMCGYPARIWIRRCQWNLAGGSIPTRPKCGPASDLSKIGDLYRLDAVSEQLQINFLTPNEEGPYELELEFLIESGPNIDLETANRLTRKHAQCAGAVADLSRQIRMS